MTVRGNAATGTAFGAPLQVIDSHNNVVFDMPASGVLDTMAVAAASVTATSVTATNITGVEMLQADEALIGGSAFPLSAVKRAVTPIDCSAGGTAETTAAGVVPAGSILLGVIARTTEAFDGDATTTLEVGIAGNIDKYIDTDDFDPSTLASQACSIGGATNDHKTYEYLVAELNLIATWTNTAAATEGEVEVIALYV